MHNTNMHSHNQTPLELLVLFEIARGTQKVEELRDHLTQRKLDFSQLIAYSEFHRMEGLLYLFISNNHLGSFIPGKYLMVLNQRYEANVLRNMAFLHVCDDLSTKFDDSSLIFAFIKGLSPCIRNDIPLGVKSISDIDLLITLEHLPKAIDILQSAGFVYGEYDLEKGIFKQKSLEDLTKYEISPEKCHHLRFPFISVDKTIPGSAIRIELHLCCAWRNSKSMILDTDIMLQNTKYIQFKNKKFRVLEDQDEIAVLCLQFYHDLFSFWDVAVRNKDFELYRFFELRKYMNIFDINDLRDIKSGDESWVPYLKKVRDTINLLIQPNLDLNSTCPESLREFGLESDGVKGIMELSLCERFLLPQNRFDKIDPEIIGGEEIRRSTFWFDDMEAFKSPKEVRQFLLTHTIMFLKHNSPFYSSYMLADDKEFDLKKLPIIDKKIVSTNGERFICKPETKRYQAIVTGTTTGKPLYLLRGEDEIKRTSDIIHLLNLERDNFILRLFSGNHGPPSESIIDNGIILPIRFKAHFEFIYEILRDGILTTSGKKKIDILVGGLVGIKRLAQFIQENPRTEDIQPPKVIIVSGTYLTETWRKRLAKLFKTKITQIYGLSEFPQGTAYECSSCGHFHFPFTVFPELIPLNSHLENVGELVLSHLYPFAELQPLLRYNTRDLMVKEDYCSVALDNGYSFLGRSKDVIDLSNMGIGSGILPISAIAEILEMEDYTCYRADSANFKEIIKEHRICNSVFSFKLIDDEIIIFIECSDKNLIGNKEIENNVLDRIVKKTFEQTHIPLCGNVRCELVCEGTLGNDHIKY